jgi:hypothetical protein
MMSIGKIVKSESHINYICRIFGPREADVEPEPADYAFGRFVRVAVKPKNAHDDPYANIDLLTGKSHEPASYAVGVIYDTILQNPAFGALGPRLSNEMQVEIFSPDYIAEKAVLIYIMILGMVEQRARPDGTMEIVSTMHGVPLLSLELDSEIEMMNDDEVQAFHYFGDPERTGRVEKYLHMGYLPHIITQRNSLLPMVTLRIIDQLERLFPQHLSLLSIVKRNFAWRLKVETTG